MQKSLEKKAVRKSEETNPQRKRFLHLFMATYVCGTLKERIFCGEMI